MRVGKGIEVCRYVGGQVYMKKAQIQLDQVIREMSPTYMEPRHLHYRN